MTKLQAKGKLLRAFRHIINMWRKGEISKDVFEASRYDIISASLQIEHNIPPPATR